MNDGFWHGRGQPSSRILYGVLGEEVRPGVYRFTSTEGYRVPDAHILSPDVDLDGNGETTKPRPGSACVALMTSNGAQCFVCGFARAPVFDENSDDEPGVDNPADNNSAADKVYRTSGGAVLTLKRGGAITIESPGASVVLNPLGNQISVRSANYRQTADGYLSRRGRKEVGTTGPETVHEESFLDQVGPAHDRFSIDHGDLQSSARRRLTLVTVTGTGTATTATVKTRETYFSDGSWVGEGPKYQWGGAAADEPHVLGNALVEAFGTLFNIIKNLKVNTAWGPSTVPLPPTPIDLNKLESELSGKILSTFMFLTKDPADLG